MNSQLRRQNTVLFIAFTLSLAANSLALTLNLVQGYHTFTPTQRLCYDLSDFYLVRKYEDCSYRPFLVMTTSLFISEFFTIIGFLLSLSSCKNKGCTKNQWFVKNKFQSLYLSAAMGTIGLAIASGWQTTILVELLLPNQSIATINIASIIAAYFALALFIIDIVLVLKCNAYRQYDQNLQSKRIKRKDNRQSNNYQLKICQIPKNKELKSPQVKVVRKNIKSTKKKQELIKNDSQNNKQYQLKEPFFEELKHSSIYQTTPNQLQNEPKLSLSSRDLDEHLDKVVNCPAGPQKMYVPKLALNMIANKKKQLSAKNSLSKLDISAILPIKPNKIDHQCEENNSDNVSILGGIKEGKIPVEVIKSPRPDIKKIRQAVKAQNIILTQKNNGSTPNNIIGIPENGELSFKISDPEPLE